MKFYSHKNIDSQRRIALGNMVKPKEKVEVWVEENDFDLIYVKSFQEINPTSKDVPKDAIRSIDEKCRLIIPAFFCRGVVSALIAYDKARHCVVLKLLFEKWQ